MTRRPSARDPGESSWVVARMPTNAEDHRHTEVSAAARARQSGDRPIVIGATYRS